MKLKPGQWFMWSVDSPMPDALTVFEGPVERRMPVITISRFQAMALKRWQEYDDSYCCYKNGNGDMRDVYVVGDVEAWYGPED